MIKPEIVRADWRGWFDSNPTTICCTVSWLIVLGCMSVVIYDVNSEDEKENSAIDYQFIHMVVAVMLFFSAAAAHYLLVDHLLLLDGKWFCALISALPFYISREISDMEKEPYPEDRCLWLTPPGRCFNRRAALDVPGLLYPTITIFTLYFTIIGGRAVWRQWQPDEEAAEIRPGEGVKKDVDTQMVCENETCVRIVAPIL